MPRATRVQKGPETPYFAIGQNSKSKKVAYFFGETFGADGFSPPKVPLGPGNRVFFRSWPGISLGAQGYPRPKGPRNPYFVIIAPGAPIGQNAKRKKGAHFLAETFAAVEFPPKKLPLALGNRVFLFLTRARNFCKSLRPKTGHNTRKSPFAPTWGSDRKKDVPEKVAEYDPGNNFFFDFWAPAALRTGKGPVGPVACCSLVAYLLACWTRKLHPGV